MFFIVPLGHLHIISSKSIHNFMSNVIYKQTDRQTFTAKNTTSFILICLYSLKLNDNKHSRFCKVTHTRDFHGLQLVHKVFVLLFSDLNGILEMINIDIIYMLRFTIITLRLRVLTSTFTWLGSAYITPMSKFLAVGTTQARSQGGQGGHLTPPQNGQIQRDRKIIHA